MKVNEFIERLNDTNTFRSLCKEVQIPEKRSRNALKDLGLEYNKLSREWVFNGDENVLEDEVNKYVPVTNKRTSTRSENNEDVKASLEKNSNVQKSAKDNSDFTIEEIKELKNMIEERKNDYELFDKYKIYDELSKVPTDEEIERCAYNLSKTTNARLKNYAKERRLPLQDLVELAIIDLLDRYDKN
ncbi:hypothetical protein AWH48_16155 [Domibacillus aminovorans]|uniref:Uncharacterized protein n=1 Tax=Domibacillus aminovorans TaxID=29332 RepID=A0A177L3C9_9BACI|nr:hypothetical protein [Domibacillus aminovorans]OAH59271.1 hypothetical protein AWH48_16155 [Domibacillus aminovorans]